MGKVLCGLLTAHVRGIVMITFRVVSSVWATQCKLRLTDGLTKEGVWYVLECAKGWIWMVLRLRVGKRGGAPDAAST